MKRNIGIMVWQLKGGGAERAVANLSRDLIDNYNVFIFLFDASNISYPYCGNIVDIKWKREKNLVKRFISFFKHLRLIKKEIVKNKIELMISFMQDSNRYNVLLKNKCKCIISFRNMLSVSYPQGFSKKMVEYCSKKADMIVTLSEGVRNDLLTYYSHINGEKVVTIYNSCDPNWFFGENDDINKIISDFDFNFPIVSSAGRLTYQKGHWHLLRAFSLVLKKIPSCKLVIFGQGELLQDLKEYAARLGISDSVFFMGYVRNYHAFVKKCTAFVFPSLFEGLGNVQLEALACDLPVISTDCDFGPREILDGYSSNKAEAIDFAKYGILVKPFSYKCFDLRDLEFEESDYYLSEAIEKVVLDKTVNDYYKKQAAVRKSFFYPDNIKGKWLSLIEGVLNDK